MGRWGRIVPAGNLAELPRSIQLRKGVEAFLATRLANALVVIAEALRRFEK